MREKAYTVEPRLSGPRLSGLFDYPDFYLWSQFFHEYELVVILKTQSRKKPNESFQKTVETAYYPVRFSKFASATRETKRYSDAFS